MNDYGEDFRVLNGVMNVRLSGEFPHDLLGKYKNIFQPLIDACSDHGCKKALIDARDLQVDFNTIDLYQIGGDAAHLTHIGLRVALLAREDMIDRFFDSVARNLGGRIGVFTDMSAANDWLQNKA
jgi:hypothetical protein